MRNMIDLGGWRFGRLEALGRSKPAKRKTVVWLCVCQCGNFASATTADLRRGRVSSCGCSPPNKDAHSTKGLSDHPLYMSWMYMIYRCHVPRHHNYCDYGGRGVFVCEEWRDFRNFIAWSKDRPEGGRLHRISNDGPYSPSNCFWSKAPVRLGRRRSAPRLLSDRRQSKQVNSASLQQTR